MAKWEFPSNHYAHMNILNECKEFLSPIHKTFVEPGHYGEESYQIWMRLKIKVSILVLFAYMPIFW